MATVEVVERFRLSDDPTAGRSYDLSLELRRIVHLSGFQKLASSSKVLLLSFFRMISSLEYSDFQIFDDTNLASLQQHEETLRNYVDAVEADNERQISNREKRQYQAASRSCMNRSLFATKEGNIGLGPGTTAVGDQVVVLINCPSAMLEKAVSKSLERPIITISWTARHF